MHTSSRRETYHDAVYHASWRRGGGGRRACVANRFQVPPPPLFGKLFARVKNKKYSYISTMTTTTG